jgi:hypothetical protein
MTINTEKTVEIANSFPKGKGEIVQKVGHFLSIDLAEVVNKKIESFFKNQSKKRYILLKRCLRPVTWY